VALADASVSIASWNVLNTAFMHWIYKNEQGLRGSAITTGDVPAGNGLTRREVAVVALVECLLFGGCRRHDVVCLQEVGAAVYRGLRSMRRAAEVQFLPSCDDPHAKDRGLVIFDPARLSVVSSQVRMYSTHDGKYAQWVKFAVGSKRLPLCVVSTHCPWGNGKRELAGWLAATAAACSPCVVIGDMNNGSQEMAAICPPGAGIVSLPPTYRTHINAQSFAVDYDNTLVCAPATTTITAQSPKEVIDDPAMHAAVALINPKPSCTRP
jgi:hypothetical protein